MKHPTFKKWLASQRKRQDPVGDLARDVASDSTFPRSPATFQRMRDYQLTAVQRAEEDGYARGLRDAQAHPEELGLRKAS